MLSLAEIGPVTQEEKILFNSSNEFEFCNFLPLKKGGILHLNKLESPTQGWFVPILVEIGLVVLEKTIFQICYCIFFNFAMFPLKYNGSLIRINLNSLHSSMIYAKFGWKLSSGPAEDFKNPSMYFRNFADLSI